MKEILKNIGVGIVALGCAALVLWLILLIPGKILATMFVTIVFLIAFYGLGFVIRKS